MNIKNNEILPQKIREIAQQKNADICLACELALQLRSVDFTPVKPLFEAWVARLPQLSYEAQIALSRVWHCHATTSDFFVPDVSLILAVQHAWWQTWLAIVPAQVVGKLDTYLLAKALEKVAPRDKASYEALLKVLMADKPVWSKALLRLLKTGMGQALLAYEMFEEVMLYLFEQATFAELELAYDLLHDFYFCFAQCPEVACRKMMNRGEAFEVLGLKILALWGTNPLLEAVLSESQWSIEAKLVALEVLQANATVDLADEVVGWLAQYPAHSKPLIASLLAMAYEGVLCNEGRMTTLVKFYFTHEALSARELVLLLHQRFDQKLNGYLAHHSVTPQKLVALLATLGSAPAQELLHQFLQENRYPNHFHQVLQALVTLDYRPAEETILTYLPTYPVTCTKALERLGGTETIAYLKEVLQADQDKTHVPSIEVHALPLWLKLTDDATEVLAYVQKNNLPNRFGLLSHLPTAQPQSNQTFLLEALFQSDLNVQMLALQQLAKQGDREALPAMVMKLVNTDELIQNTAWQCVQQLAQRLAQDTPNKSAQELLTGAILGLLSQAQASIVLQQYLDYLAQCLPPNFDIDLLTTIGQSKDPHVLKFYIQCLGASKQPKAFYLIKRFLHLKQDIFTLRQALLALTQMSQSRHEPQVIALLQHHNMNIKKTAVDYLKVHGTQQCVLPLTRLLIGNDNSGLRTAITAVLQSILGANLPFVLLHELSKTEQFIQQRFLVNTLIDLCPPEQLVRFAANYAKFELPSDQNFDDLHSPTQWLTQWRDAQQSLQKQLEEIEDLRTATDQNPALLNALPATQELMANYLRNHPAKRQDIATWCHMMYQHELILTKEEAYLLYANASGGAKSWGWQTLNLDKAQEALEWTNWLNYNNPTDQIFLLRYFIPRKGLKLVLAHWLQTGKNIAAFRKLLGASGMVPSDLPQVLLALYEQGWAGDEAHKKQLVQDQRAALANWLISTTGALAAEVQQKLFRRASLPQRLHLLMSINVVGQSLLKQDIVDLYTRCIPEQKEVLLSRLKNTAQHEALLKHSFEEYLGGQLLRFWQHHPLNPAQLKALSEHPQAATYAQLRQKWMPWGNEVLRQVLQESMSDKETLQAVEAARSSFAMLSPERQWQILEPWLAAEELHWLDWLNEVAPVAPQVLTLLQQASPTGQLQWLAWINGISGDLFVPRLAQALLKLCVALPEPLLAVQVLFRLSMSDTFVHDFALAFAKFDNNHRTQILTWLLAQTFDNNQPIKEVTNALRQYCTHSAHQVLLWQMDVQNADYAIPTDAERALHGLKKLAHASPEVALAGVENMLDNTIGFSPRQRMHWLAELYVLPALEHTITHAIATIFADELLALTFLPQEVKIKFEKRFCEEVKSQQLTDQLLLKKVLKNFAEDPVPVVNELMEYVVFHEKHRDLKSLCLRLLKKTLAHANYLEICFRLLKTTHLDLLRTAIRTLTFAHYAQAIPDFIKLLFHKDKNIAKAAQNALLHQGEKAQEALEIALPRQRPDKRVVLEQVLAMFGESGA